MSLLNFFEIIPPKEEYLQEYIYNELKTPWRDNKSDAIADQIKYFESYFLKKIDNSHINREIVQDYLKESEKVHHTQLKENDPIKSKYVEVDCLNPGDKYLYYHDNSNKKTNIYNFELDIVTQPENFEKDKDNENEINLTIKDNLELNFDFDTQIRKMLVPSSDYFRQSDSNIVCIDMYSIYNISLTKSNNDIILNKCEKLYTLDQFPNSFMSNTLVDSLFIISNSSITPSENRLTVFNNEYRVQRTISYNNSNLALDNSALKGEFFNHPQIVMLYKESGQLLLSDFRSSKPYERKINNQITNKISDLKFIDGFKYIVFSTKTISLYDSRYASIPISQFPLNINYQHIDIKQIHNTAHELTNYIGIDTSRRDSSVLLFDILNEEVNSEEFFSEFIDTRLMLTNKYVYDATGILHDDEYFIGFTADDLGGLYCSTYSILNCINFTKVSRNPGVTKIENNFRNDNAEVIKDKDDQILSLFEKIHLNSHFKKKKEVCERISFFQVKREKEGVKERSSNISNEDDRSDLSSDGVSELLEEKEMDDNNDEENVEMEYGTATVNGEKKKMYKIQNKRKILEFLINTENIANEVKVEINKQDDMQIDREGEEEIDGDVEENRNLDWLFDLLEDNYYNSNYSFK